jgi:cytochrome c biogenesis protein CcdA
LARRIDKRLSTLGVNEMKLPIFPLIAIGIVLLSASIQLDSPISIQFFHIPNCTTCEKAETIIDKIARDYGSLVSVEKVDISTLEGARIFSEYKLIGVPAVIVEHKFRLIGDEIREESIKKAVDSYLSGEGIVFNLNEPRLDIPSTFLLGLFSGFSPCLMSILGFILTYSFGILAGPNRAVNSFIEIAAFGIGMIVSLTAIGATVLILNLSFGGNIIHIYLATMATSFLTILLGLNLVGVFRVPLNSKSFIHRLANKLVRSPCGLFVLGFLFTLTRGLCAAPFLIIILSNILIRGTTHSLLLLLTFNLGLLIPFLGVGVLAGIAPRKAKNIMNRHQSVIKTAMGLLLICFGLWYVLTLPTFF